MLADPVPVGPADPLGDLPSSARQLLVVVCLLSLTFIINNLVERAHIPVPEAIVTVLIGVAAGAVVVYAPNNLGYSQVLTFEDHSALQFMLVFIAPIIFAEGYGMKSKMFFDNLTRILFHAFLGTVVSTIVVGLLIYYIVPHISSLTMSMAECLAFGAMISATDPVTTLAIFKQQGLVEKGLGHLYFTVLGEAILNDAVGITLFDGFSDFVKDNEVITAGAIGEMAGKFCVTFGGSMLLGIACGILTALILKLARMGAADEEEDHAHFNLAEVLLMLGMSYIPFLIATAVQPLSGIVAVLFAGITSRHYAHYNMSKHTREAFLPIVELLAITCETYTFLLVGIAFFVVKNLSWPLIGITAMACLVGRALQVYGIGLTMNFVSKAKKFTCREMHISFLAGLRGAIAFMCALGFPQNGTHQHREYIISTTMVIVIVSMTTLGWPTAWFLKVLKIGAETTAEEEISLEKVEDGIRPAEAPLHADQADIEGTSRFAKTLGGTRAGFLDKGLMRLVMTTRAIEERNAVQNKAHQYHQDIEGTLQGDGSFQPFTRTSRSCSVDSRPTSFIPGQNFGGTQLPSFTPGQAARSYTPGQTPPNTQLPTYTPGQAHTFTPGQPPSANPGCEKLSSQQSLRSTRRVSRVNP